MTILAMRLISVFQRRAHLIFEISHNLKMNGPNAVSDAAQMVKLKSCWDGANKQLISKAVGSTPSRLTPLRLKLTVPFRVNISPPKPVRSRLIDKSPEAFFHRQLPRSYPVLANDRGKRITMLKPTLIVGITPTTRPSGFAAIRDATLSLHRRILSVLGDRRSNASRSLSILPRICRKQGFP